MTDSPSVAVRRSSAVWMVVLASAAIIAFLIGRLSVLPVNGPTPHGPIGTPGQAASDVVPAFNLECGVMLGPDLRGYTNTKKASFVIPAHCQSGLVMLPKYTRLVTLDASVDLITRYYFRKQIPTGSGNGTPLEALDSVPVALSQGPDAGNEHVERANPVAFNVLNQQPVAVVITATFN